MRQMNVNSETTHQLTALKSISALRTLAHTLHELQHIETPALRLTDEMIAEQSGEKRIQAEQDEAFRTAWHSICDDLLSRFGMGEPALESTMLVDVPAHERYEAAMVPASPIGDASISLSIRYYATGDVTARAEYTLSPADMSTRVFYEGDIEEYDPIAAGEHVANASLTCLVLYGLSAPEALDYWQTRVEGKYSQVGWAEERGVTHQSVAHNAAKAESKLDDVD
jgi:hypothetical protein